MKNWKIQPGITQKTVYIILTVILVIFIFLGFYKGIYIKAVFTNSVEEFLGKSFTPLFNKFQKDSDSLIFSTLIYNRHYSFNDGVMVVLHDTPDNIIRAYKNGETPAIDLFKDYTSQTGFQTIIYLLLDKIFPFSNDVKFEIFYGINALFSAIAMTVIIIWLSKITSWVASLGLTIYISVFGIWIILFSKSVYWAMWTWFLPIIISIILIERYIKNQKYSNLLAWLLICSAVIIKCLCGFEYITAVIITMTVPYFYYWVYLKWKFKDFIKKLLIVVSASISGFIISLGIWIIQYAVHFKSVSKATEILMFTVFRRIPGDSNIISKLINAGFRPDTIEIIRKSLEISAASVVWTYITKPFGPFRYGYLILIILFFTITGIFILRKFKLLEEIKRKITGLIVSTWITFIAPISWFFLAKGHSFIHTHINFVLWDLPFILFGIVLILYIISILFAYASKSDRLSRLLFKVESIRKRG